MRTAFIHIGMHKTGSTSIQHTLAALDRPEHHYVREGAPNHSVMLRTVFEDQPTTQQLVSKGYSRKDILRLQGEWRENLAAELAGVTKPNIVLSGEVLSSAKRSEQTIRNLHDFLSPFVDRFQVIGYVRSPVSLIQSAFQQKIKMGRRDRFEPPQPHYRQQLEKFDTVFGRENVTLVKFDRDRLIEGDAVMDFAHRIGLPLEKHEIVQTNASLSLEAISLLYARNKHGMDFSGFQDGRATRNSLRSVLEGFGSGKFQLSAAVLQPALDAIADDLDWIEDRLGETLRDMSAEGREVIDTEEDLLSIAASQTDGLRALLLAELDKQDDPVRQCAEMADMLRLLAMARRGKRPTSGNDTAKARKARREARARRRDKQAEKS